MSSVNRASLDSFVMAFRKEANSERSCEEETRTPGHLQNKALLKLCVLLLLLVQEKNTGKVAVIER